MGFQTEVFWINFEALDQQNPNLHEAFCCDFWGVWMENDGLEKGA